MAYANIKATLASDIRKVWDTVTDLKDWSWRSGLDRIEVLSDTQFVEYTEDGFATTFTVTLKERYKRWEFDMENSRMQVAAKSPLSSNFPQNNMLSLHRQNKKAVTSVIMNGNGKQRPCNRKNTIKPCGNIMLCFPHSLPR